MIQHEYTIDQFNLFTGYAVSRKLDGEATEIAIVFNAVAAAFGSKKSARTLEKMLADRYRLQKLLKEQKTDDTPADVGRRLLAQLTGSGIPVRRRHGKVGRVSKR